MHALVTFLLYSALSSTLGRLRMSGHPEAVVLTLPSSLVAAPGAGCNLDVVNMVTCRARNCCYLFPTVRLFGPLPSWYRHSTSSSRHRAHGRSPEHYTGRLARCLSDSHLDRQHTRDFRFRQDWQAKVILRRLFDCDADGGMA